MRSVVCVCATAIVLGCLVGAVAAPSGSAGRASVAATPSGYNFKARVQLNLTVEWREDSSLSVPCSEWRQSVGKSVVYVKGVAVPGRFQLESVGPSRTGAWATIVAVGGKAAPESFSRRLLVEAGGSNWNDSCSGTRPPPFVAPPKDCDKFGTGPASVRDFQGQLVVRAGRRKSLATLDDATGQDEGRLRVIVVDGAPLRGWYRRCRVSRHAPDMPANMAGIVDEQDVAGLRRLKPGESYSYSYESGPLSCVRPNEISDNEKCSGSFRIQIQFRRVAKGEQFP